MSRLYLTSEERLRFKKLLERVTPIFLYDHKSSLSFQVACKFLKDFIKPLSPISKTRQLIQEFLSQMENQVLDVKQRGEMETLLKELLQKEAEFNPPEILESQKISKSSLISFRADEMQR